MNYQNDLYSIKGNKSNKPKEFGWIISWINWKHIILTTMINHIYEGAKLESPTQMKKN